MPASTHRCNPGLSRVLRACPLAIAVAVSTARADWENVGSAGFSADAVNFVSLVFYNGEPYVAYQDGGNSYKATLMRYTGGSWQTVGAAGFSAGIVEYVSLAFYNGEPYVAYQDGGNGHKATVMRYTDGSWQTVGTAGFSDGACYFTSLAFYNGEPYVAYQDESNSYKATLMRYTGGSWQTVGAAGFSASTASYLSLAFYNGEPYVAYQDQGSFYKATVMRYTGGSWQTVGAAGFSAGACFYTSLAFYNGEPYVAYEDGGNSYKATLMRYTGGSWQTVGAAGFSAGTASFTSLAFYNGEPYVAYQDEGNSYKATLMRYTGGSWQTVGAAGFSAGITNFTSLAFYNGEPYVAYQDEGNSFKATLQRHVTTVAPTVTTAAASNIGPTTATCGGNVTSDGGDDVTTRGVCWNTTGTPTVDDSKTADGSGTGEFTSDLTGLTADTTYYVRAYATNGVGTSYGDEVEFTTDAAPTVTTAAASNIGPTTATCGGNVTSDGGDDVTTRGVCWNTTGTPTVDDSKTADGSGTGEFTSDLTGLTADTTYYVRAYATNGVGTTYGDEVEFTTDAAPTVTTAAVSNIHPTTATCGGDVTSDGGDDVTTRGVCWNTTGTPTVDDSKTADGSGTGEFTSDLTGLTADTTYYVRAYATNGVGTTYGEQRAFTTAAAADDDDGDDDNSGQDDDDNSGQEDDAGDGSGTSVPDLRVSIAASNQIANVGDELAFEVQVSNLGDGAATNVTLRVPLPPGMEFVSAQLLTDELPAQTTPPNAFVENGEIVVELGEVPSAEVVKLRLVLKALVSGAVTLTAAVASDELAEPSTAEADADVDVQDVYWQVVNTVVPVHACGWLGVSPAFLLLGLTGLKRGAIRRGRVRC